MLCRRHSTSIQRPWIHGGLLPITIVLDRLWGSTHSPVPFYNGMGHEEVYPAPPFLSPFLSRSPPLALSLSLLFFFPPPWLVPRDGSLLPLFVLPTIDIYMYIYGGRPPYLYVYVVSLVHACMRMRVCRCIPVVCPRLVKCLLLDVHHSVLISVSSVASFEKGKGGVLLFFQSWGFVYISCPMCSGCLVLFIPCPAPPTSYLRAKYDRSTLS